MELALKCQTRQLINCRQCGIVGGWHYCSVSSHVVFAEFEGLW